MSDLMLTPENTKLIVEWMGHEARIRIQLLSKIVQMKLIKPFGWNFIEYNPITNADQSRKVEEKLLKLGWYITAYPDGKAYIIRKAGFVDSKWISEEIEEETLELVIYKAALQEAKK